jgi:hypothetical protein
MDIALTLGISIGFLIVLALFLRHLVREMDNNG